jgi:membrane protease YdiL (CAAX protease family)
MNANETLAVPGEGERKRARKFALVALALWLLQGIPITIALMLKIKLLLVLAVLFMHWGLPFLAAFKLEKRGAGSLGLLFRRRDIGKYSLYILAGFILVAGVDCGERFLRMSLAGESAKAFTVRSNFLEAIVIQLLAVGLPEEILYRGFLMTRLCDWLGKAQGLLWSALIFGSVHTFSRLAWIGGGYASSAFIIGLATFLAGVIFGLQYLKTHSILPSAVTHISLNLGLAGFVSQLA